MSFAAGLPFDPFSVSEIALRSNGDISGKIRSDPHLTAGEKTGIFLVAGQSNAASHATASSFTPTHPKIDNLNLLDGGVYKGLDPALGCSGTSGSWLFRFADLMIGTFDRIVMVPIAIGGTSILEWLPSGDLGNRIHTAQARIANLGLSFTAVLWQQGETDGANGMSQATYLANLRTLIGASRTYGIAAPWFVGKSTYSGGVQNAGIRAACVAVVDGVSVFAGADTDTLTGTTYREPGLTHFNEAGVNAAAALWKAAVSSL